MEKFRVGDKVLFDHFKCEITSLFKDCETGEEYATVKPIGFESFEREVKISRIKKVTI